MSRPLAIAFVAVVILLQAHSFARAAAPYATLASTYARLKPSLALVAHRQGKDLITGSSFCIANGDGVSYFLTSDHVVAGQKTVAMFLSSNSGKPVSGTVVRANTALDVAVIAVKGYQQPAIIGTDKLPEGQAIAIAGYPSAHIEFALAGFGLTPSVHAGIVTSYQAQGGFIEFDAQVEHGNSGGPLFDPDTGLVYGIVALKIGSDQTNLAVSMPALESFMRNAGLEFYQATRANPPQNVDWNRFDPATGKFRPASSDQTRSSAPPVAAGPGVFDTYLPLRNAILVYDCGGGVEATTTERPYGASGDYAVTYGVRGTAKPVPALTTLEGHDTHGNEILLGYFRHDGLLVRVPIPVVGLPLRPSSDFESVMPATEAGAGYTRHWAGSTTLDVPYGHFDVQVYEDQADAGTVSRIAFADQVGAIAFVWFRDGKPSAACALDRVDLGQ